MNLGTAYDLNRVDRPLSGLDQSVLRTILPMDICFECDLIAGDCNWHWSSALVSLASNFVVLS